MECEGANREQERKAALDKDFLDLVTLPDCETEIPLAKVG